MRILAIDPGSTSTKVGVWEKGGLMSCGREHSFEAMARPKGVLHQESMRFDAICGMLLEMGCKEKGFDAVVGRGGLLRPVPGGVYKVCDRMLHELAEEKRGSHASNLGAVLAWRFARKSGCPCFVADPVVVDELCQEARLSGLSGLHRKSIFHALNHKAVGRHVAREMGRCYGDLRLIVAHLGGGISVGAHRMGRVVDVNNALNGDGPYSPERAGSLPVSGVLELISAEGCSAGALKKHVASRGGLCSYLETVDLKRVEARMEEGDARAGLAWRGMVYQIAKEIGSLSAALDGEVDAIVLTGGMAHSRKLTSAVSKKVSFIAEVKVVAGEHELQALCERGRQVLEGVEPVLDYGASAEKEAADLKHL